MTSASPYLSTDCILQIPGYILNDLLYRNPLCILKSGHMIYDKAATLKHFWPMHAERIKIPMR